MVCMVNQTALDLIKDAENGGSGETNQRPATCNGVEKESSNDTTSGDRVHILISLTVHIHNMQLRTL